MSKHTPGPWALETTSRSEEGSDLLVTTPDGAWNIADCRQRFLGIKDTEEAEANARLIAAAPELLQALKFIADKLDAKGPLSMSEQVALGDIADAAIAKATK